MFGRVREQGQEASALDGRGQAALMLGADAAAPSTGDFTAIRQIRNQQFRFLVINIFDLFYTENAETVAKARLSLRLRLRLRLAIAATAATALTR